MRTGRNVIALGVLLVVGILVMGRGGFADTYTFNNLRYQENTAALKDSAEHPSFKYIPLGDHEDVYLSIGGQARLRWELWENFGFAPMNDDDFGLLRLRLHGDLQLGEHARVFVEGKSALLTDRDLPGGRRTLDEDTLDLQNAFLDIQCLDTAFGEATFRLGRQELQFGNQRLVSPLDWANTRRTFDGVRAILKGEESQLDAFWSQLVEIERRDFNEADDNNTFWGAYGVGVCPLTGLGLDLYYLGLDRDGATFREVTGNEERHTIGARLNGKLSDSGLDVDLEGGHQFGDHAGTNIEAYFASLQAGYQATELSGKPRLYLGFDYASGDDGGGNLSTFNQLFPLAHAYLGYVDVIGRQNILDFSQGVSASLGKTNAKLENHFFWRDQTSDAVYNAGGGVLRAATPGAGREVGQEIDLTLKRPLDQNTLLVFGYSHFFAGDFIEDSGPSEDIDWAYTTVQYTF